MKQYKGMTFAKASQKIANKYKNRDTDKAEANAFQAEIAMLMQAQEQMKAQMTTDNSQQFAFGGGLMSGLQQGIEGTGIEDPNRVTPMIPGIQPQLETLLDYPSMPEVTPLDNYMSKDRRERTPFGDTAVGSYMKDNIYAPVAIGKGLEFAAKAFQLADGYDKVSPELNPYASKIRQLMSDRNINLDSVRNNMLSGYNNAIEGSNNVRSQSVRQSIGQNAANQLTSAMGNASLQEQQANNSYRGEEAQTLNNLGQQEVQSRNYAEQLNNQSKVGYQQSLQNMFTSVGNAGQELTNFRAGIAQQQLVADTLKTANFEFGNIKSALRTAARNGELKAEDIIKIVDYGNSGATNAQLEEMTEELKQYRQSLKS